MIKKLILTGVVTVACMASGDFAIAKLEKFNKENRSNLHIIKQTKLSDHSIYTILEDSVAHKFASAIFFDNEDFAIMPASILPFLEKKDWDKKQVEIGQIFSDVKNIKMTELYETSVPSFMKLHFGPNKDESMIYVLDPKCPHCKDEINGKMLESYKKGESFGVALVSIFGESSVDATMYMLKDDYNGDFNKFIAKLEKMDETVGSENNDSKKREQVLLTTDTLTQSGIMVGTPFEFKPIKK
jgi:hypothetical protein